MKEEWRTIKGFNKYQVSNLGRVKSFRRGAPIIMKPGTLNGYRSVAIYNNKGQIKGCRVNRLVITAFVGPCPKKMQCAHLDGVRSNNVVSNLKWVTAKENQSHKKFHGTWQVGEKGSFAKLKNKDIPIIKLLFKHGFSAANIGTLFKVHRDTIYLIVQGKTWSKI